MHTRSILLLSTLITCVAAYVGHADAGGLGQGAPRPAVIEAKPIRDVAQPMSRAEGREAADAAVAGALVGLTNEQFKGERIELKLNTVDMRAVSPRDREVSGTGQMKIGNDTDWRRSATARCTTPRRRPPPARRSRWAAARRVGWRSG